MFELRHFISDCRAAFAQDRTHKAVREVLARAISNPATVLRVGRADARRNSQALSFRLVHNHQCGLGAQHDGDASQSPYVGDDRHLHWSGRQHLLATPAWQQQSDRSRRCTGAMRGRCRAAGSQHYSFGHQSNSAPDRRHPCLRRRLLCCGAQRMGL